MELALKAWLVDNAVTTDDKTDQILQLESAGKVDIEAIYKEMFNKTTGIQPETIMHVVQLYHRTVTDFLLTGCTVNTGLFYASPSFQGVYKDAWDPEKNSIVVNFQTGKELRESIAQTKVVILGQKASAMQIDHIINLKTKAEDGNAPRGGGIRVEGRELKVVGDAEEVGVYLEKVGGLAEKLPDEAIFTNKPSELVILVPQDLTEGAYTLRITTQYTSSGGRLLKTPRSIEVPITLV